MATCGNVCGNVFGNVCGNMCGNMIQIKKKGYKCEKNKNKSSVLKIIKVE